MKVISEISLLREKIAGLRKSGESIGFTPTMGNLHEGHLSLLKQSVKDCDRSILSIYVNPTQFGKNEDLDKYPRTLEKDLELAKENGCDIVFTPDNRTMYPCGYSTYVIEDKLSVSMEGKKRPGHFKGVLTIVSKLFNIVQPDKAYFGQKDFQQAILIKKMVKDLNIPVDVEVLPTLREKNGLAMSSRNNYLSKEAREKASTIYKALQRAEEAFQKGEKDTGNLLKIVKDTISAESELTIDYVGIRDTIELNSIKQIEKEGVLAIAAAVDGVHLIDNIILKKSNT